MTSENIAYGLSILLLVSLASVSLLVITKLSKDITELKLEISNLENDKALLEIEKHELITGILEEEE